VAQGVCREASDTMINVKEQKEREDLLNLDFYMFHTFTEWALYSLNESAKLYLTD
jgi:hypothetical protein